VVGPLASGRRTDRSLPNPTRRVPPITLARVFRRLRSSPWPPWLPSPLSFLPARLAASHQRNVLTDHCRHHCRGRETR